MPYSICRIKTIKVTRKINTMDETFKFIKMY